MGLFIYRLFLYKKQSPYARITIGDMKYLVLRNGVKIPQLGFGTHKTNDKGEGVEVIKTALKVGYRLLDTAQVYGTEDMSVSLRVFCSCALIVHEIVTGCRIFIIIIVIFMCYFINSITLLE